MKTYIKIVMLLLCNYLTAQEPPVLSLTSLTNADTDVNFGTDGNYAIDTANERNQYVGTWQYNQNGILFQVKIEKKDKHINQAVKNGQMLFYNYSDVVTFKYKLVKNGVTIYDNLNQINFPASTIIPTASKKNSNNYLHGEYLDVVKPIMGRVNITRLNTNPAKINFDLYRFGYYLRNPDETYDPNQPLFTMPTDGIQMVKIN